MKYYFLLFLTFVQSVVSQEIAIYAPGDLADRFGSAASDAPFNRYTITTPDSNLSIRYQQVISPSSFGSAVLSGGWIKAIAFRADEGGGLQSWGGTLPDIQVTLSTTTKQPDALSPVFAENIGTDSTVVFGRGSLTVQMSAGNGPGPATSFGILFQKPFFYDPSRGNLLLDIRNFQAADLNSPFGPTAKLDAVDQLGDGLSRIFSDDVNSLTASHYDSLGLFCEFNFTPVPEPTGVALLLLGSSASFLLRRASGRHRGEEGGTGRQQLVDLKSNTHNRYESR